MAYQPALNPQPISGKAAIDQTTNIIATNIMQNAAVALANGVNLNVQGYVSALISVTGTMGGGTAITFEASIDDTTFVAITAHQIGFAGNLTSITISTGDFRISCAGYKSIRARISTYGTGTITAKGTVSVFPGHPTTVNSNIIAALPVGTNTIGKAGIDQTTLGTTNNVSISGTTGAGTSNLIKDDTGFGDGVTTGIAASTSRLYNGTTYDRARGDITAGAWVQVKAALPTGANTIGTVIIQTAATSVITSATAAITSTTVLAANANRKGAYFYNDSTSILYLAFAAAASNTAYTVQLPVNGYYEMPEKPLYTGLITGIWVTAVGAVRVTELS